MKRWLFQLRQRATQTPALPISECEIDDAMVLEATGARVILNLYDRTNLRGWRSSWSRAEAERIHAALGSWLATGRLEDA